MTTPEGTTTKQALRSRRVAGCFFAAVLVALGALAGIDLGIPIGRQQQARIDEQRTSDTRQWQGGEGTSTAAPALGAPARDFGDAAPPLPQLPDVAGLGDTAQLAFKRFDCTTKGAPSTQCAALTVLQADSRFEPGSASAPAIRLGGADGVYKLGERMALAARAGSDFDGFLYVDYFDREGNVVHLRPGLYSKGGSLKADSWVDLGGRLYIACPPLGTDLVVAISTPLPIFARERPKIERADHYLGDLHAQLLAMAHENQGARPTSSYAAIVTVADGPNL